MSRRSSSARGFTLAELVMVVALISLLAGIALPVAKFTVKRQKEAELRLALRGRTILIGGEPGSGKSALAGLLCDRMQEVAPACQHGGLGVLAQELRPAGLGQRGGAGRIVAQG